MPWDAGAAFSRGWDEGWRIGYRSGIEAARRGREEC